MLSFSNLFTILMIPHILGDFYFQTDKISSKKEKELKWVIYHSVIYGIVNVLFIKFIFKTIDFNIIAFLIVSHAIIDILKYYFISKPTSINIFVIDQFLHLLFIFIITFCCLNKGISFIFNEYITQLFSILNISLFEICSCVLKILLIHKPINIFIAFFMKPYKKSNQENKEDNKKENKDEIKAGRIIGTFERMIMLFFINIGQYSSIGLVLTAKSIARYDKISKSQSFAEYYLLGTLLSTISVLIISLI